MAIPGDWWLWVIIGAAMILFASKIGFLFSAKGWKGIGAIVAIVGLLFATGAPFGGLIDFETADTISEDCITTGWDIDPVELGTTGWQTIDANWDSDEKVMTIPLDINVGTAHYALVDNQTKASFNIEPLIKTGADNTQLATLKFKTDYAMTYSGEDVLLKSGNTYYANWSDAGESWSDYEGSDSYAAGSQDNCTIHYTFDFSDTSTEGLIYELYSDGIGATISWRITFYDECGFSETFIVNAVVVDVT